MMIPYASRRAALACAIGYAVAAVTMFAVTVKKKRRRA